MKLPDLPDELVFYTVRAFNQHGESRPEHGECAGVCSGM